MAGREGPSYSNELRARHVVAFTAYCLLPTAYYPPRHILVVAPLKITQPCGDRARVPRAIGARSHVVARFQEEKRVLFARDLDWSMPCSARTRKRRAHR